jgi:hypothetical protein
MTLKKKLLVATAAGALTVAAAVPAMALENEFHGMYKLKYFVTNYETGSSGTIVTPTAGSTAGTTVGPKKSATAANYFEQRARIFYTAKANDDLKLVTGFEIDSVFGDKAQGAATRGSGGALETDAVNLETKWVYLDFNIPTTPVNVKTGLFAVKDGFKGTFIDADIAGVLASAKYGSAATALGYFRAYEGVNSSFTPPRGTDNLDIAMLSGNYAISKDLTVGGQYFLYADYRTASIVQAHVFGVNAEAKFGPATVNGFFAYQAGFVKNPQQTISAFAGNVTGKVKAGPGTAKAAFLYTSGDKENDGVTHDWISVQTRVAGFNGTGTSANSFNDSGMMLLNRNTSAGGTSTDQEIIYTTNNNGRGVILGTLGYDATITPKLYANANVGAGFNAENRKGDKNGSHYLGTEINAEVGYKMFDNLTASLQAAYVFLGPNFDKTATGNVDPVDPYTARVVLSYAF